MRLIARISFVMALAVMAAPSAVQAQSPGTGMPKKSLFGRPKMCADCQRAAAMSKGASVPLPPPLPGVAALGHSCSVCGGDRGLVTKIGTMTSTQGPSPQGHHYNQGGMPGYATTDGQGEMPGYATTDGGPAPLGEAAPHMMAGAPGRSLPMPVPGGPRDPSLQMSGYSPNPVIPLGANRPRVLSHLFGFSEIGRDWRESRGRRAEEAHAMTRYGANAPVVSDLPARMVYGR